MWDLEPGNVRIVLAKRNTVEYSSIPKYDLKGMKGKIQMKQKVVIQQYVTIMVKGAAKLIIHSKWVNVHVKPMVEYLDYIAMARSHGVLRPGVGKVDVCLLNYSTKHITLPRKTAAGETAGNKCHSSSLGSKANRN